MTASKPMSVQAKGQPAAIVPATTQMPKAIIPAEIRNENTISMIDPLSSERKQWMARNLSTPRQARRRGL
jgi:hypothetical protein